MKKTNEFDADGFLSGMFHEPTAGDVTTTTTPPAAAPEPGDSTTPGDGVPIDKGSASCTTFSDLGDLLPATGEWDSLPDPEPCPTCGGIDCWWGLWGERRCERCEPSGQRSLLLANRAARLRERTCQKSARSIR